MSIGERLKMGRHTEGSTKLGHLRFRPRRAPASLGDETGQTLTEYALLLMLVAIACVAAIGLFGDWLLDFWNTIVSQAFS